MQHPDDILIPDLLAESAHRYPSRVALSSPAWRLTFGDVHARTNALAHALVTRGVRRGDEVVIFGRGSVQTALALWAVLKANATAILVVPDSPAGTLRTTFDTRGARVLVSEARLMGWLQELAHAPATLEHALICGAVAPEQLPPLPGAVCALEAMAGQGRRLPPVPESSPDDVAFVAAQAGVLLPHTHRAVIARLPATTAPAEPQPPGLLARAGGIERMLQFCRDGARLHFESRVGGEVQIPVGHAPRTP